MVTPTLATARIVGNLRERQVFTASQNAGGPGDAHSAVMALMKMANLKGVRQLARLVPSISRKRLTAQLSGEEPLAYTTVTAISEAIKAKYPDLLPDYE